MNEIQTLQMKYEKDFSTYEEARKKADAICSACLYIENFSIQRKTYGVWKLEVIAQISVPFGMKKLMVKMKER